MPHKIGITISGTIWWSQQSSYRKCIAFINKHRLLSDTVPFKKKNHKSTWDCGNQTDTSSACVKTLWCIVERSLNFTQDHQRPYSAFTLLCRYVLKVQENECRALRLPYTSQEAGLLCSFSPTYISTGLSCPGVSTKTYWGKCEMRPQQSSNPILASLFSSLA